MTDAGGKVLIGLGLMAIAAAMAFAAGQPHFDGAGWAQAIGSLVALAVVWRFSRQEALDRRAEAEALAAERRFEREIRAADRLERVAQWEQALRTTHEQISNAARTANQAQTGAIHYYEMRFVVGRLVRQSERGLELLLRFEAPTYTLGSYVVAALEYLRPALRDLELLEKTDFDAEVRVQAQGLMAETLFSTRDRLGALISEYQFGHR